MTFVDLFAGCGGLSLGLLQAGWEGLFAIEKSPDAFNTLRYNLIDSPLDGFSWPSWLDIAPITTSDLLFHYSDKLKSMKGDVDLLAGGPPCQGYSFVGRRNPDDPRNTLYLEYLEVVRLMKPRSLLFENVKGFNTGFKKRNNQGKITRTSPHSELVYNALSDLGYKVFVEGIISSEVGIPQPRNRFVLFALKKDDNAFRAIGEKNFFDIFRGYLPSFREYKGLEREEITTARMALSDLETDGKELIACVDSNKKGYRQVKYYEPINPTKYQVYSRNDVGPGFIPNSMRLAKHNNRTVDKFKIILESCVRGKSISDNDRKRLSIKKHAITPLDGDTLSATITTLPDDILHYSEPRILTVREMARLQSFPDWFSFLGQYTTGSSERKFKCPRYTQVGNAVPPLLSEALGKALISIL